MKHQRIRYNPCWLAIGMLGIALLLVACASGAPAAPADEASAPPAVEPVQPTEEPAPERPTNPTTAPNEEPPWLTSPPEVKPVEAPQPEPQTYCITAENFRGEQTQRLVVQGIELRSRGEGPLFVASLDDTQGLFFPSEGMRVQFPAPALGVELTAGTGTGEPVVVIFLGTDGEPFAKAQILPEDGPKTEGVDRQPVSGILFEGGGFEGVLFKLCIRVDARYPQPAPPDLAAVEGWVPYPPGFAFPGDGTLFPAYPPMRAGVKELHGALQEQLRAEGLLVNTARAVVAEEAAVGGQFFERVSIAPLVPASVTEDCVDFQEFGEQELGPELEASGFLFRTESTYDQLFTTRLPDSEQFGLFLPNDGIRIQLPSASSGIVAEVLIFNRAPLFIDANSPQQGTVDSKVIDPEATEFPEQIHTVSLQGREITELFAAGDGTEAVLVTLCSASADDANYQLDRGEHTLGLLVLETDLPNADPPPGVYLERTVVDGNRGKVTLIDAVTNREVLSYTLIAGPSEAAVTDLPLSYIVFGSKVCLTCRFGFCQCRTCSFFQRLLGQGMEPAQCDAALGNR